MIAKKVRTWSATAGACAGLVCLLVAPAWLAPGRAPCFRDVQELRAWAEARGLHCQSDRQDGRIFNGMAVSTRPLTWLDAGGWARLQLSGHEGAGLVWAINRGPNLDRLSGPPWYGECRAWGGILVTGDPRLLDRLEAEGP